MNDTIESLRAELAEVERERDVRIGLLVDTIDRFQVRAEAAEAACAEMRAALEHWTHIYSKALSPPGHDTYGEGMRDAKDQVRALLARIDLGRGWVGPEVVRRVVERAVAPDGHCHLCIGVRGKHMEWCPVPDLDALLDDGKVKP